MSLTSEAIAIRDATATNYNTAARVGGLLLQLANSAEGIAASNSPSAAVANTALIQAAIDAAYAAYVAGAGVTEVRLPDGDISLGRSTSTETFYQYGVAVPATDGCIIMRNGVRLVGGGAGSTILKPTSPAYSAILLVDGTDSTIGDIGIDGSWSSGLGNGMGICNLSSNSSAAVAVPVSNLTIRNVSVQNVGSYGLGIENGDFTNVCVENFRAFNTGADGIDVKNRPFPPNDSKGIRFSKIYIRKFGQRLSDQAGIDVRGICHLEDITVIVEGALAVAPCAVRFRPYGFDEGVGNRSSMVNFYIRDVTGIASAVGIEVGCQDIRVASGTIENCYYGYYAANAAGADRNSCIGVTISGAFVGFYAGTNATFTEFSCCNAVGCTTGFQNRGVSTTYTACGFSSCATGKDSTATPLLTEIEVGNQFGTSALSLVTSTGDVPALEARGTGSNVDIWIKPKGTGRVKFGTRTASADAPVTGYIEIIDAGGTLRRLAVIG